MSRKLNRDGPDLKPSSSSSLQNMADAAMEMVMPRTPRQLRAIMAILRWSDNIIYIDITGAGMEVIRVATAQRDYRLVVQHVVTSRVKMSSWSHFLLVSRSEAYHSDSTRKDKSDLLSKHRSGQVDIYKWLRLKDINFGVKG
ncbi:hypothetical protein BASA50_004908 [Batrachochytrium salamandrivorans]|uniref:Uncharacterized protein n=1 Tax=Batrachochytrium salamandrivorans TaxID=1357716 RepID=A0ABQ8FE77_9FUNG|nr:hypothetical protein BASA50_004908 [Batrachochytrium salamandrivorans]